MIKALLKRSAQALLPTRLRQALVRYRDDYRYGRTPKILLMASRPSFASGVYFGLVNKELLREARAVAAGRLLYGRTQTAERENFYLLRRNIHRLEKGLIMRPRRASFAAKYIGETVDVYGRSFHDHPRSGRQELRWATDVLTTYFDTVEDGNPHIAKAKAKFEDLVAEQKLTAFDAQLIPFERDLATPIVSIDEFRKLSMRRRSVRWYREEPLPRALIDEAIEVAAQAPSACNRQPFHYRVYDDSAQAREIAGIAMGTAGFAHQLPALVVLVGQLRAYPYERDRHAIYIDASLSAMSFMLALETLGAASCPINWPDHEPYESRIRARLRLEPDERVIMLIGLGWPDPSGLVPRSVKRQLEHMRSYNQ